jgi:hypothetical protein
MARATEKERTEGSAAYAPEYTGENLSLQHETAKKMTFLLEFNREQAQTAFPHEAAAVRELQREKELIDGSIPVGGRIVR